MRPVVCANLALLLFSGCGLHSGVKGSWLGGKTDRRASSTATSEDGYSGLDFRTVDFNPPSNVAMDGVRVEMTFRDQRGAVLRLPSIDLHYLMTGRVRRRNIDGRIDFQGGEEPPILVLRKRNGDFTFEMTGSRVINTPVERISYAVLWRDMNKGGRCHLAVLEDGYFDFLDDLLAGRPFKAEETLSNVWFDVPSDSTRGPGSYSSR